MLTYEVSGIFAHKETIKQFLQPMIEQVFGRGGGGKGRCAAIFGSGFQSYYMFVLGFFNSLMPFFGSILPIFASVFAVYYLYFIKKSNSVLGTKFS